MCFWHENQVLALQHALALGGVVGVVVGEVKWFQPHLVLALHHAFALGWWWWWER